MRYSNGDVYEGNFLYGYRQGYGVMTKKNGMSMKQIGIWIKKRVKGYL